MNRLLWKEICTILHLENELTYEQRQSNGIWQFCLHLRQNLHLVPHADRHFLWKSNCYFYRQSITSVLNWEKRMRLSIIVFADKGTHDIRRYVTETNNTGINLNKRKVKESENSSDETIVKKLKQTNMNKYLLNDGRDNDCIDDNDIQMRNARKRIGRSDEGVFFDERKKRMKCNKDFVDIEVHSSVEKIVGFKRNIASPNLPSTRNNIDIASGRYSKHPRLRCSHVRSLPKHGPTLWDPYLIS